MCFQEESCGLSSVASTIQCRIKSRELNSCILSSESPIDLCIFIISIDAPAMPLLFFFNSLNIIDLSIEALAYEDV
jgi:hypothetical protein